MSIRDVPGSHKILIPLYAGLSIGRAYNPAYGGIGGPGHTRVSLPESWVLTPGTDPVCNGDPSTDKHLLLWLDASEPTSLTLGAVPTPPVGELAIPAPVLRWADLSGRGNHAVPFHPTFAPKLVHTKPLFPSAVDFSGDVVCDDPATGP